MTSLTTGIIVLCLYAAVWFTARTVQQAHQRHHANLLRLEEFEREVTQLQ